MPRVCQAWPGRTKDWQIRWLKGWALGSKAEEGRKSGYRSPDGSQQASRGEGTTWGCGSGLAVVSRWWNWHCGTEVVRRLGQGGGRIIFRARKTEAEA